MKITKLKVNIFTVLCRKNCHEAYVQRVKTKYEILKVKQNAMKAGISKGETIL